MRPVGASGESRENRQSRENRESRESRGGTREDTAIVNCIPIPKRCSPADPGWPRAWTDLGDAEPECLWYCGSFPDEGAPVLSIVGSRRATTEGRVQAYELAKELSSMGVRILSGLARGIDAAALEGAIAGGVPPMAILGNGLPSIYPRENSDLALRLLKCGGLLASEWPPGTPPKKYHFPLRNRLISAWSQAVVVIEATKKSGSLITAHQALEQGRALIVFPGSVNAGRHSGCHALIQEGAELADGVGDALRLIREGPGSEFEERELERFIQMLRAHESSPTLPDLQQMTGWTASRVLRAWWRLQKLKDST